MADHARVIASFTRRPKKAVDLELAAFPSTAALLLILLYCLERGYGRAPPISADPAEIELETSIWTRSHFKPRDYQTREAVPVLNSPVAQL